MNGESLNPYQPPGQQASNQLPNSQPPRTFLDITRAFDESHFDQLVVLATFDNPADAHFLCTLLRERGIKASVNNESSSNLFSFPMAGMTSAFWLEVQVLKSDFDAAHQVKQEFLKNQVIVVSEIPEWVCQCGETVDAGFSVCWNCEAEFVPNQE